MNETAQPAALCTPQSLRRMGIVQFPLADMLATPSKYAGIVDRMFVHSVDTDLVRNIVMYRVWHASLEPVPEGSAVPRYEVTVWDGRLIFSLADVNAPPILPLAVQP